GTVGSDRGSGLRRTERYARDQVRVTDESYTVAVKGGYVLLVAYHEAWWSKHARHHGRPLHHERRAGAGAIGGRDLDRTRRRVGGSLHVHLTLADVPRKCALAVDRHSRAVEFRRRIHPAKMVPGPLSRVGRQIRPLSLDPTS